MDRVFMNDKGLFYKAAERAAPGDMEKSVISVEALAVLPADGTPMSQIDMDVAIEKYRNNPPDAEKTLPPVVDRTLVQE